ncbi:dodecin domain-containing protein [Candidatus Bathyarchaeota archaeon]|jgi:hypothetical protein|nr:dodecin domain-containing protein [Candidatus Bathyarchaeota archaeon]
MATLKIVELVGVSKESWQDAVKEALKEAAQTIRKIQGIDVIGQTADVKGDQIVQYRTNVRISFLVEDQR